MIRIFAITAPLGAVDGDAATATLQAAMDKLIRLHPALREASVAVSEGVLTMTLRVSGRDQWATSLAARKIGSSMLYRVGIDTRSAAIQLVSTPPNRSTLTKEQGRSYARPAAPYRPRLKLELTAAPEDPS
jgi:hypothetical protein